LQVGIGKVALVDDAIAVDRERVMEFAGLTAIGNPADVVTFWPAFVMGLALVTASVGTYLWVTC
jgi:hypothetical protein